MLGRGSVDLDQKVGHQDVEVFQRALDIGRVEAQGLVQLLEDTDEVDDESDLLLHTVAVDEGAIHARKGLEQHVVAHRLVEVHRIQHRRVVPSQQLVGDDEDLGLLVGLLELSAHLLLAVVR